MSLANLTGIQLPGYMSKRRLLANYVTLALKTTVGAYRRGAGYRTAPFHASSLPPGVWGQFTKVFEAYFEQVAVRYMLDSFIVRRTMLPASSADFAQFAQYRPVIADYFAGSEVSEQIKQLLATVPAVFHGVEHDMLDIWLWSYFWPFYLFREHLPRNAILETMPVELGAGTGLFNLAIGGGLAAIFDLPVVLHLQHVVAELLREHGVSVPTTHRTSDLNELEAKIADRRYGVMSYWAFTEFPRELRELSLPLLKRSEYALFASNPAFQGVDNRLYFQELAAQMPGKQVHYAPIDWHPYAGHTYILIK